MSTSPRTRATASSVLRRAFAPYAMTTSVALRDAAWVSTAVAAHHRQHDATAVAPVATPAPERELVAAGA